MDRIETDFLATFDRDAVSATSRVRRDEYSAVAPMVASWRQAIGHAGVGGSLRCREGRV